MDRVLLNLKETVDYLGIGMTKLRGIVKDKDCAFSLKIGNRWYVNKTLLDKWLEQQVKNK